MQIRANVGHDLEEAAPSFVQGRDERVAVGHATILAVERDDARIALQSECHARRVPGIGQDRYDVLANFERRHRGAESGEKSLDRDALPTGISLGARASELGL